MTELLTMSTKELDRVSILSQVLAKEFDPSSSSEAGWTFRSPVKKFVKRFPEVWS